MKLFYILLLLSILLSCSTYKNLKRGESSISFHSIYGNDTLTVSINDSVIYNNHSIGMIQEWGISSNSTIYLKGNEFRISGKYKTTVDKELEIKRTLIFDTILKSKNGRFIDLNGRFNDVYIEQSNKVKIVE